MSRPAQRIAAPDARVEEKRLTDGSKAHDVVLSENGKDIARIGAISKTDAYAICDAIVMGAAWIQSEVRS